jgi:hypothetical protein
MTVRQGERVLTVIHATVLDLGPMRGGHTLCVFFNSKQPSHNVTASVIFNRCPMSASAARTLNGAAPVLLPGRLP